MGNKFTKAYLYSNLGALKKYLTNNEISVLSNDDSIENSLSDNHYDGLLLFSKKVSSDDVIKTCSNNYEIAVVIEVFVNGNKNVIGVKENGERIEGKINELKNIDAFLLKDSISFSNVIQIIPVKEKLSFLKGDTTLKVPEDRMSEDLYSFYNFLSSERLDNVLSSFNSTQLEGDFDSEEELDSLDDLNSFSELESFNSVENQTTNYKNKLLGALLMLIQGNHPIQNKLNANAYCILTENNDFLEFISSNLYQNMPFDIAEYVEKPNESIVRFYKCIKDVACNKASSDSLFHIAIKTLLENKFEDKEEFKTLFLDQINDEELKIHAKECLDDLRARNRIWKLKEKNDDLLPIYFLYTFFDYGYDRVNSNIIEFELDNSGFTNIILSLYALKNGMEWIYEEFKDKEIIYACEKKIVRWLNIEDDLVSTDTFFAYNCIKIKHDNLFIADYRCNYINNQIEYEYVHMNSGPKIQKSIDSLKKQLNNILPFEHVELKKFLESYQDKEVDISKHKSEIHRKYLSILKRKNKKKKENKSNKTKGE